MAEPAIRVEGLGKRYRLGTGPRYGTLRDAITQMAAAPGRLARRLLRRDRPARDSILWALRDISFEVPQGEVLGVIGHNGAGKSTLLKILARITEPTEGWAEVRGRIGALLEVGTGFHPELTGRENIYLSSAVLGMSRERVARQFDAIVSFAEVETFVDTPVKFYSSGMYLRLAFSVAAHLEPDILLADEVLAVGDAAFQRKCLGKIGEVAAGGRTVLLVSHNLATIMRLSRRVLVLDKGRLRTIEAPDRALSLYLDAVQATAATSLERRTDREGNGRMRIARLHAGNGHSGHGGLLHSGEQANFTLAYEGAGELRNVTAEIKVTDAFGGPLFTLSTVLAGVSLESLPARGTLRCHVPALCLAPSHYQVTVQCFVNGELADRVSNAAQISVLESDFFRSGKIPKARMHGHFLVPHEWSVE